MPDLDGSHPMRIAVFGAGGVGGYFGGRWAAAGVDVTLVARGPHLEAIRTRGLRIASPLGDAEVQVRAVLGAEELGDVDAVVVATKTWQLPAAAEALAPHLGPDALVLGLQNGVEAADELAAAVGRERVLGGTCRIISVLESPGVIRHLGADPTLVFGERAGGRSPRAERLYGELARADGLTVELSEAIELELWRKLHFFAPMAAVGAATRAPVGVTRSLPETRALLRRAMDEVQAVAEAKGLALEPGATDRALAFIDTLPAHGTSSLQRDLAAGRRSELDALTGAIVRLGEALAVPTPVHATLHTALLPHELAARGEIPRWTAD